MKRETSELEGSRYKRKQKRKQNNMKSPKRGAETIPNREEGKETKERRGEENVIINPIVFDDSTQGSGPKGKDVL